MILVDTSIWIEFLKRNETVFTIMQQKLERREIFVAECIIGELLQGAKGEHEQKIITSYWECLPKINESGIWIEAGAYSGSNKLISKGIGLIDAVILMIARKSNSKIWTLDKKLLGLLKKSEMFYIK